MSGRLLSLLRTYFMRGLILRFRQRVVDFGCRAWYYMKHRKTKRKYLILGNRQVGIGNRIIGLANMYSWAGKEKITLVWMTDSWVPTGFTKLFKMSDAPGFDVVEKERHSWSMDMSVPGMPVGSALGWQFWVPPAYAKRLSDGTIYALYNDTPQWAHDIYEDFFQQLRPSDEVRRRIGECQIDEDVIRVQIRNSSARGDVAGVASVETFLKRMEDIGAGHRFFVSCMEPWVSKMVKNAYGDRIIELPHKNYHSMIDAVADMWILGGGRQLICQRGSTFAEVAWWWRGCKSRVHWISREYTQPY